MKRLLVVFVLVCLAGAAALLATTLWGREGAGAGRPLVSGGTPASVGLLERVIEAGPAHGLVRVVFGAPLQGLVDRCPKALALDRENEGSGDSVACPPSKRAWLYIETDKDIPLTELSWQAAVLAVGYQTQAHIAGAVPIAGYTVAPGHLPSAERRDGEVMRTIGTTDKLRPRATLERSAIEERFQAGARAAGVDLDEVAFWSTPRLAVRVTVTTDDPATFVEWGSLGELLGDESGYDTRMLRVLDTEGKLVTVLTFDYNLGAGSKWVRSDLDRGPFWGRSDLTPQEP